METSAKTAANVEKSFIETTEQIYKKFKTGRLKQPMKQVV